MTTSTHDEMVGGMAIRPRIEPAESEGVIAIDELDVPAGASLPIPPRQPNLRPRGPAATGCEIVASWQTFLFADLVGFTALAQLEGDERALEVALGLQRRVHDLLRAHRTEQVKAIGDGLMLRSANPQDAIRLGVQLVHDLADRGGFPPLRVGIHTGPALGSNGDWYGTTVNIAARLCAIAPGGEVLISETTRSTAGRMTDLTYGDRELHRLRNVREPIATYRVSKHTPHPGRASGRLVLLPVAGGSPARCGPTGIESPEAALA